MSPNHQQVLLLYLRKAPHWILEYSEQCWVCAILTHCTLPFYAHSKQLAATRWNSVFPPTPQTNLNCQPKLSIVLCVCSLQRDATTCINSTSHCIVSLLFVPYIEVKQIDQERIPSPVSSWRLDHLQRVVLLSGTHSCRSC